MDGQLGDVLDRASPTTLKVEQRLARGVGTKGMVEKETGWRSVFRKWEQGVVLASGSKPLSQVQVESWLSWVLPNRHLPSLLRRLSLDPGPFFLWPTSNQPFFPHLFLGFFSFIDWTVACFQVQALAVEASLTLLGTDRVDSALLLDFFPLLPLGSGLNL